MPRNTNRAPVSALRHRDFRLLWIGLLLSGIGSQFTSVAMAWQIYELTDSAFHIGLLGLARAIPQIGLLLVGGLLADAINRRKLMMAMQLGQFSVSTMLVILTLSHNVSPLALYIGTMLLALFSSVETPARQSLVPNLIPRQHLANALALHSSQRYVSMIAGPSLAGLVLAFAGAATCYMVDALSWLAMLLALALLRTKLPGGRGWQAISLNSLREGFAFVRGHQVIFSLMVLDFGATFFGSLQALLPIYARDILLVGPEGLGILYSATGVGSLLAGVWMSVFGHMRRAGLWILIGVGIYGICTVLFAGSRTFWLSILMLAGAGMGNTISTVLRGTINQLSTPDELRGRMSSINSIFTNSGPQLGQFESGVVAALLGAELSVMTGGMATLVIVAWMAATTPSVRQVEIGEKFPRKEPSWTVPRPSTD